jgi:hypothetical protein
MMTLSWTQLEQAALDAALAADAANPCSTANATARWRSISTNVPGRGARECLARFMEIRAQAKVLLARTAELNAVRKRFYASFRAVEVSEQGGGDAFSITFTPLLDSRRAIGALLITCFVPLAYPASAAVYKVAALHSDGELSGDPLQARCAQRALKLLAERNCGTCSLRSDLRWLDNHFDDVAAVAFELSSRKLALEGGIQAAVVAVEESGGAAAVDESPGAPIEHHVEWIEYAGAVATAKHVGRPADGLWTLVEQQRLEAALVAVGTELDWGVVATAVVTRDEGECRARYVELHALLQHADALSAAPRGRRRGRRKKHPDAAPQLGARHGTRQGARESTQQGGEHRTGVQGSHQGAPLGAARCTAQDTARGTQERTAATEASPQALTSSANRGRGRGRGRRKVHGRRERSSGRGNGRSKGHVKGRGSSGNPPVTSQGSAKRKGAPNRGGGAGAAAK